MNNCTLHVSSMVRSLQGMLLRLVWAVACLPALTGSAYEVWIGTSCTPSNAAVYTSTWSNMAVRVKGLNINMSPCIPDPGTPCENETRCGTNEWQILFDQYVHAAGNGFGPMGRSVLQNTTLSNYLETAFSNAALYGFSYANFMFFDNMVGTNLYQWTVEEVQEMRDWLDASGHADVGLMVDARSYVPEAMEWCENSLVEAVVLEANAFKWFENYANRQTLLSWLWTNSLTSSKPLVFQVVAVPESYGGPYGATNNYMVVRNLVRWLGSDLMGWDFNRSSRVVFMPVTYNYPTYTFYPETKTGNSGYYTNTLTSLTLSLMEQKNLFEARTFAPTEAEAYSLARHTGSRSDLVGYWNCDEGTGTTAHGQYGGADGTLVNGAVFSESPQDFYKDGCVYFDGVDDKITTASAQYSTLTNNFTIMAWVNPTAARSGTAGTSGQRYAVYPPQGNSAFGMGTNHVGVGFSVGTNGVGIYEHGASYIPQKLSYTNAITGWTHIAVTYTDGIPRLYINGTLVSTGTASDGRISHPGCWGGSSYGWYKGYMDEFRVYDKPLTAGQIVAIIKFES